MTSMSEKNPKRRVYSRPIKSVKEMTEAEIDAFATAMYERMMGLMPGSKESDKSDSD
jgi:hypothetical protein